MSAGTNAWTEESAARLVAAGDERLVLLREIGERRQALEAARGGASLPLPAQEVVARPTTTTTCASARRRAVSDWNAQISLMTGMAAAGIMLAGQVGILDDAAAPHNAMARFRRQAAALGARWPAEQAVRRLPAVARPGGLAQLA